MTTRPEIARPEIARPDPTPLVLWLGRLRAGRIDAATVLADVCVALPEALGVAGATALAVDGRDPLGVLVASDDVARGLGEVQRRVGRGPLLDALCAGRSPATDDLALEGPPALAAAAAESGLVSSLALPIEVDGERTGALQLLGDARQPVGAVHGELVGPLLRVLAARLADARALEVARTPPPRPMAPLAPEPAPTVAATPFVDATAALAAVQPPAAATAAPVAVEPRTDPFAVIVPAPRTPQAAPRPRPTPFPRSSPDDDGSAARTAAMPIVSAGVAARLRRGRHASDTATSVQKVVPAPVCPTGPGDRLDSPA